MTAWVCVDDIPAHGDLHVHISQTYELRYMSKLDPDHYCDRLKIGDQVVLTAQAFLELAKEVEKAADEIRIQGKTAKGVKK